MTKILALALFAFAASAQEIPVGNNPESVIPYGNQVFASNMGVDASNDENGDGYISLFTPQGKLIQERYLPAPGEALLHSPLGMEITNDILYVTDLKKVVGFSLLTKKRVFESQVPDQRAEYLNDLVSIGDGRLMVSATNLKKLFSVDMKTGEWAEFMPGHAFQFVNGLSYDQDDKILYLAHNQVQELQDGNGRLTAISLKGPPTIIWELGFGRFLDGITRLGNGHLMVSDWGDQDLSGQLHIVDARNRQYMKSLPSHLKGTADIAYDPYKDILYIPAVLEGKVSARPHPFPVVSSITCPSRAGDGESALLGLDELKIPRTIKLPDMDCTLGRYSSGEGQTWYRSSDCLPQDHEARVQSNHRSGGLSIEVERPRIPSCPNGRACDPSSVAYSHYNCMMP